MANFNLPTEVIELPSKGLLYSKDSPLSSGKVEMKYMTAREEDILSNQNYIEKGTAIDKLLESLIVNKDINYNDLLVGDKNALMIAARILSYGKNYEFSFAGEKHTADLSKLDNKEIDESLYANGNNFELQLPQTDNKVTIKLLSHKDENDIDAELEGKKKIDKEGNYQNSTRLKYIITSVNGQTEKSTIRDFVDNYLLANDARHIRKEYNDLSPDIELVHKLPTGEEVPIPLGIGFFYPDYTL